ncbi:MAG: autotransporter domain-containing protein [Arenimonas sp.]
MHSSNLSIRNTFLGARTALVKRLVLAAFLLMLGWAPQVFATTGCEIFISGAPSATVNVSTVQGFSVLLQDTGAGSCTPTDLTFTAIGDTTGGVTLPATITGSTFSPTGNLVSFNVTAGPTGGGSVGIQVNCTTCFNGSTSVTFGLNTNNVYAFTPTSPSSVTTNQLRSFTLSTNLLVNGAGSGATYSTDFFTLPSGPSLATVANNAAGNASTTNQLFTAGTRNIEARVGCPTALPGCPPAPVPFTVLVEAAALTPVSGATSIPASTTTNVVARYGSASLAAPIGTVVTWGVTTNPGDGALSAITTTDGLGNTQATFTATVPGVYIVTASRPADTFVADTTESFTITVTAIVRTLTVFSGNGQNAATSTALPAPLVALAQDNGVNAPGITVNWTSTGGTLSAATSVTNAAGQASIGLTMPATPGPVTITGVRADDGTAIATFTATATLVRTLTVFSGNGQTAPTSTTLPLPLVALAQNNGIFAPGVTINWAVVSGSATLSAPTSVTNAAAGQASITVNLGPIPGPIVITGTRADDATAVATFTATSTLTRTLTIVSGNSQNATPGSPLASALVVNAKNNGISTAGVTINWSITAGSTLGVASNVTSGTGAASNTATLSNTPGTVTITATRQDDPTVFVSFTANGVKLAGIPNLSRNQFELATALDSICTSLNTLNSPTSEQIDFRARCRELANNAASNPADVVEALDALLPDTQAAQARASMLTASRQFETLNARIAALRSGTQGSSFDGLALNGKNGNVSLGGLVKSLTGESSATEVGGDFQRWGFFASGTIGSGDADAAGITPDFDFDIHGLTLGVDYRYSDKFIFGAALGYNNQDTDLAPGQGGVDAHGYTLSAYGTYFRNNSWYTDGVITLGKNNYDMVRQINYTIPDGIGGFTTVNQTARSDSGGDLLSIGATFGRDFQKGGWSIGPYGRLLYTKLDFDRIEETLVSSGPGAGLGLIVEERSLDSLASILGGKFTRAISTNWGVLTPHFQLEWEHEYNSDPGAATARFINDPTGTEITLSDAPYDADFYRIGLGLSAIMSKGRSGFMYYEKTFGRDGVNQQNLALGLRIEF